MATLQVDNFQRLPASEIFGANLLFMLSETSFDRRCDTGIKRFIGAEDHVDLPVHCREFLEGFADAAFSAEGWENTHLAVKSFAEALPGKDG
ncbi:MAG: hypothetical protein VB050_18175 [Geobacteraceae bacterium]|nr:hypothetical protein [Geobacteraceae bacterium]